MNKYQPSSNQTNSSAKPGKSFKRSSSDHVAGARSASDRGGIDTHPYQRGSVIEVIYGVGKVEDSDVEEDFNEDDYESDTNVTSSSLSSFSIKKASKMLNTASGVQEIRLADIIDRCQSDTPTHENPAYRYKYYIHYRDYNRRMDEWISDPLRIVSPPSVGNAKVREMKKAKIKAAKEEEEKRNRERAATQHQHSGFAEEGNKRRKIGTSASDASSVSPLGRSTSQRASSRRAIAAITSSNTTSTSVNNNSSNSESKREDGIKNQGNFHSAAPSDDTELSRLTRRQRRKCGRAVNSSDDNDATQQQKTPPTSTLPGSTLVTTLLPGQENIQDKVVTVAARELDEHEGLDEASLREHEEVTKVKNVGEVQLGRYRMNAWYFSPIPKEMISNGSTVDVLYVCEFTLNFFPRKDELLRFQAKDLPRNKRHPPGNEIYR